MTSSTPDPSNSMPPEASEGLADTTAEQGEISLRERIWRVIFLSDTPAARTFDVILLAMIFASVITVMLESVSSLHARFTEAFFVVEWVFTAVFGGELLLRLAVVRSPRRYLLSFFGIVDLLAILPAILELFLEGTHYLIIIRILRLLRMFRILKMGHHLGEASELVVALKASQRKIAVFLIFVCSLVCIEGTLVYLVETGTNPGFANIPQAMYWAVVTLTTVGYGDVAPITVVGKILASIIMLTGFAILAVPTGVVAAELNRNSHLDKRRCRECGWTGHDFRALHCQHCGVKL